MPVAPASHLTLVAFTTPHPTYLLGGVDDARRNDVAFHDASKDVDQDGLDLGVPCQDLECLNDLQFTAAKATRTSQGPGR
jgi:hypothetical protein